MPVFRSFRPFLAVLAAAALAGCASVAQGGRQPEASTAAARAPAEVRAISTDSLRRALSAYLERVQHYGLSGAVLVAKDGEVLVHGGYGLADREGNVSATAETVFDIGSITKQFTAAAILRLEEQGRLRVEDTISRFFTGVPADKRGITIHHLLTHSSGLIGDLGGDYQVMPRDTLIRRALASELQWAPGTRYDYSNLGYSLLGAIIERASGQSYEQYLRRHLLQPAGMWKTGYRIPEWTARELAVGYRGDHRWGTPLDHVWAPDGPWWNLRANGGLLSTVGDLYLWHLALQGDRVLSAESRRKFFQPHVAEDPDGRSHYAYGWAVFTTSRQTKLIAHNGGNGYFFADFLRYVDEDVVAIVATNASAQEMNLARDRVLGALFDGNVPQLPPAALAPVSTASMQSYAGVYSLPSGARIEVSIANGMLQADALDQGAAELLANTAADVLPVHRELSATADRAMEGAGRADFAALHEASDAPERSEATYRRIRAASEENLGSYRSHDVLGTVNVWWGGAPDPVTFVRLNFERGTRLFRLHWDERRIVGYGGFAIPNPARATLMPQGGERFIGYNIGIEHSVPMRFETGEGGAVRLVIAGADGERIAQKER
jgi:CubicO group peptidase (beta-lactamase class C family)